MALGCLGAAKVTGKGSHVAEVLRPQPWLTSTKTPVGKLLKWTGCGMLGVPVGGEAWRHRKWGVDLKQASAGLSILHATPLVGMERLGPGFILK